MSELRTHGGVHRAEFHSLGLSPADVLDFSVNLNSYGPTESVLTAARTASVDAYGDPTGAWARHELANHLGIAMGNIALGNGAAELLWTLASVLADSQRPAFVVEPTFSEYTAAARARGAPIHTWCATEDEGFRLDLAAISEAVLASGSKSLYLCTPNNPTGSIVSMSQLTDLARACPATTFIVDQAFLSLCDAGEHTHEYVFGNIVLLRSLTKDHAIPGLRVAYAVAAPELIDKIEVSRPPWTTSAPAQAALVATCSEDDFIATSRKRLAEDRRYLCTTLRECGLEPLDSSAPFVIAKVGDAASLRRRLLRNHQILVRDCASFGLPRNLRFAARPASEVDALGRALMKEYQ